MKIRLFDDDDLKAMEDMLVRAFVRAGRIIAREGLVTGYQPPPAETVAAPARGPTLVPTPPPTPPPPPAPAPEAPVAAAPAAATAREPAAPAETSAMRRRKKQRSARHVCKVVANRPEGYITTDQAREIMGRDAAAQNALSQWVLNSVVPAVIVSNCRPLSPTKGLPGRLMVEKAAVIRRNDLRVANRELHPRWRKSA